MSVHHVAWDRASFFDRCAAATSPDLLIHALKERCGDVLGLRELLKRLTKVDIGIVQIIDVVSVPVLVLVGEDNGSVIVLLIERLQVIQVAIVFKRYLIICYLVLRWRETLRKLLICEPVLWHCRD